MSKLPKLSDLTSNMPGMVDKMKSFIDSLAGSDKTAEAEDALTQEEDPIKAKLLEIELYMSQFNDVINQQQEILRVLKRKHSDLSHLIEEMRKPAPPNPEPPTPAPAESQ
jgi:predicted  nucleic acid-binding Zn-ribbon protein